MKVAQSNQIYHSRVRCDSPVVLNLLNKFVIFKGHRFKDMHSKIIVKLKKKKGCRNPLDRDEEITEI